MTEQHEKRSEFIRLTTEMTDPDKLLEAFGGSKRLRPNLDNDFVPPHTPVEKVLAEIWSELLGLSEVGIHDNFFDLGGDSLLITRFLSRVHEIFKVELPLDVLFAGSLTVAELARAIAKYQISQASPEEIEEELKKLATLSEDEIKQFLDKSNLLDSGTPLA